MQSMKLSCFQGQRSQGGFICCVALSILSYRDQFCAAVITFIRRDGGICMHWTMCEEKTDLGCWRKEWPDEAEADLKP